MSALDDLRAALAAAQPLDPNAPAAGAPAQAPSAPGVPTLAPTMPAAPAPPSSPLNDLTKALQTAPPLLAGGDSPSGSAGAPDLSSYAGNRILQYGSDVLHGRVALNTLQNLFGQNTYDPSRSFAANATDPRAVQQAVGIGMAVSPANIAKTTVPAPSAPKLIDTAQDQYTNFRGDGLQVTGTGVVNTINNLRDRLNTAGIMRTGPGDDLFNVIDNVGNSQNGSYTVSPGVYSGTTLEAARQRFAKLAQTTSDPQRAMAAGWAKNAIDDYLYSIPNNPQFLAPGNTANPADTISTLQAARQNYGSAVRSNALTGSLSDVNTGVLDQAQARADSSPGISLDKQIRSRLTAFTSGDAGEANRPGYTDEQWAALKKVAAGSGTQDLLDTLGSAFGPHGAGLAGAGMAIAETLAAHGFDYKSVLTALAPVFGGMAARRASGAMSSAGLNAVDESVRANSPLGQSAAQQSQFTLPSWYKSAAANVPWRWPASLLSQGGGP